MNYILYKLSDGLIMDYGICHPSLDTVASHAIDGVSALMESTHEVTNTTHYVLDGVTTPYSTELAAAYASNPGEDYVWSVTDGWIDGRTLDKAKAEAIARLMAQRDVLEYANFDCNGVTYSASSEDQRRIAGAVQLALLSQAAGQEFSIDWNDANNETVTLTGAELIAVGLQLGTFVQSVFASCRTAIASVNAATSNTAIDAITL
jgi:hypothetical protein